MGRGSCRLLRLWARGLWLDDRGCVVGGGGIEGVVWTNGGNGNEREREGPFFLHAKIYASKLLDAALHCFI